MQHTFVALLAMNVLLACQPALPRAQLPDQIAACEAVFIPWWNQLMSMAEEKRGVRGVYFSDCGDVAFPDSFFEKYRGSVPPVFRASELKGEPVENKDWFWHFSRLRSTDKDTFELNAGYYCGGLCAKRCDYRVRRQSDGAWKIVGASGCVVS